MACGDAGPAAALDLCGPRKAALKPCACVLGEKLHYARIPRELFLGVREARALAIRSGKPAIFRVASDAAGFRVADRAVQPLPEAVSLRTKARGGAITFYTDGTSDGGRLSLITGGVSQDFIVFPTTGLIFEARR